MSSETANGLHGGPTETDTGREDLETPEHRGYVATADEGIKGFKETETLQGVYYVKPASDSVLVSHRCCNKLPQT